MSATTKKTRKRTAKPTTAAYEPANKYEKALLAALLDAWVTGASCSQRALAAAVARQAPACAMSQRQVGIWFTKWAAQGLTEEQRTAHGHDGAAYVFNFTGRPVDAVTLRDLVEPVLTEPTGAQKMDDVARKLRTALRIALGIDEERSDDRLLRACAAVGARDLHRLPSLTFEQAVLAKKAERKVASTYRAAVRALLREAAVARRVAIVFPRHWDDDVWQAAGERWFGTGVGPRSETMRAYACYWNQCVRGLKATAKPMPAGPGDLTTKHVDAAVDWHHKAGRLYLRPQIKTMLRWVGRTYNEGPYAAAVNDVTAKWTRNGRRSDELLLGPNGEAASNGDLSTFLAILRHNGYGPAWIEFFEWLVAFLSLPDAEVESRAAIFPTRPAQWDLDAGTMVKRFINWRRILHLAPTVLGRPAGDLAPEDVFGPPQREMVAALEIAWQKRYERGEVSSATSDGLEKLVLAYGLTARALLLKRQHRRLRGNSAGTRKANRAGDASIDMHLLEAYNNTRAKAKKLKEARSKETSGHGDRSVRDLKRIVKHTPASFWIRLLDHMLRDIQSQVVFGFDANGVRDVRELAPKAGTTLRDLHCLIADTYYHGWLISTGMRISETAHIRYDIQYTEEFRSGAVREAHLRAIDRKETANTVAHECAITERYVPRWLERLYEKQTRPFFMDVWPSLERVSKKGRVRKRARPVQEHNWVFVDRQGRPFGCPEEGLDGSGRDKLRLASRLSELRKQWKTRCAVVAASVGESLPTLPREASNHVVRIAMTDAIRQELGLTAAANYTGDKEASIEHTYAGVKGSRVDASMLAPEFDAWVPPTVAERRRKEKAKQDGAKATSQVGTEPAGAGKHHSFAAECDAIYARAERFNTPATAVAAMVDEAMRRWGIPVAA